ncbi:MAG TPA: hypothetical protein PK668_10690 [Myxococcota bacterium]|nr:hypothetical protein [Myxococcota bacterium]HRY93370.1 hypothetical protein [Myxococcota bacterium]HSA22244.1 hypothetical protein [Myxococcota bacterium]
MQSTGLPGALALALVFAGLPAAGGELPRLDPGRAQELLFGPLPDPKAEASCVQTVDVDAAGRIRCLLARRYARDPEAFRLAAELYRRTGSVAGLLPEQDFDGGYRGIIHLVPHVPQGETRKHLAWVSAALLGFDDFFAAIEAQAGAPARYRWRALSLRFYRSVRKRTPAAFAHGWTVSYNVNGTLNHGPGVVRDLLFHEIFHLNDFDHDGWSSSALGDIFDGIVARCGTRIACLAPYAPGWLKVRGGTYYAFMPGNGVGEYAAELAMNYLREQLAVQAGRGVKRPFKCGPPENARAWRLLVDEFFAGVDRVPACPPAPGSGPEPEAARPKPP